MKGSVGLSNTPEKREGFVTSEGKIFTRSYSIDRTCVELSDASKFQNSGRQLAQYRALGRNNQKVNHPSRSRLLNQLIGLVALLSLLDQPLNLASPLHQPTVTLDEPFELVVLRSNVLPESFDLVRTRLREPSGQFCWRC